MQFRVNLPLQGTDRSFNPAGTHPALRASPIVNIKTITPNERRQLILVEEEGDTANPDGPGSPVGDGDPVESLINNTKWNGNREGTTTVVPGSTSNGRGVSATETPREGATELWEVANLTGDAHPIHIHLIQFQVISRQPFDVDTYLTDWMASFPGGTFNGFTFPPGVYIPGFGPPGNYQTRNSAGALGGNANFDAAKYLSKERAPAAPARHVRPIRSMAGGRTRSRCGRVRSRGSRSAGRRKAWRPTGPARDRTCSRSIRPTRPGTSRTATSSTTKTTSS